jgi:hypothetical protein
MVSEHDKNEEHAQACSGDGEGRGRRGPGHGCQGTCATPATAVSAASA